MTNHAILFPNSNCMLILVKFKSVPNHTDVSEIKGDGERRGRWGRKKMKKTKCKEEEEKETGHSSNKIGKIGGYFAIS